MPGLLHQMGTAGGRLMPKRTIKGAGKKRSLNMRTTQDVRARIEAAAGKSGRSMVQEVEHRIEQSFYHDEHWREILARMRQDEGIERRLAELRDEVASIATVLKAVVRDRHAAPDEREILERAAYRGTRQ
jgi:hypothetical protein